MCVIDSRSKGPDNQVCFCTYLNFLAAYEKAAFLYGQIYTENVKLFSEGEKKHKHYETRVGDACSPLILGEFVLGEFAALVGSHFKELQIAEGGVPSLKNATFLKTSSFEDIHICGGFPPKFSLLKKSYLEVSYQVMIKKIGKNFSPLRGQSSF